MGKYRIINTVACLCLAFLVLGPVACNQAPQVTDNDIEILDAIELIELLDEQRGVVIVDVRPDYRYRTGHIPNAINIPLPQLDPDDPRLIDAEHIVVYGDGPRNTLSHAAAKKLLAADNAQVSDFRGGFDMWNRNDHPVVTGY